MTQVVVYQNGQTWPVIFPAPGQDINDVAARAVPEGEDWKVVEYPDDATRVLVYDGTAFVAPAPSEADVRAEAARRMALLARPYTPEERETWGQQVAEARAVLADAATPTPLLDGIALGRGQSVAHTAARVIARAEAYSIASGIILGAQAALLALDPRPADYTNDTYWQEKDT